MSLRETANLYNDHFLPLFYMTLITNYDVVLRMINSVSLARVSPIQPSYCIACVTFNSTATGDRGDLLEGFH